MRVALIGTVRTESDVLGMEDVFEPFDYTVNIISSEFQNLNDQLYLDSQGLGINDFANVINFRWMSL